MFLKVLQVSEVPCVPESPQFSKVPAAPFKAFSALLVSIIPEESMVSEVLLVLNEALEICRDSRVLEEHLDASAAFLNVCSGLVNLGDVNETSGFLCTVSGFCL